MNNYIVNEASSNIRLLARQNLQGKWRPAVLTMLIYTACIAVPVIIIVALFGGFSTGWYESEELMMPGEGLSTIYSILVEGAFTFGITVFFLDLIREKKADIGQVFSGFNYYFKTLLLYVVMSIFIMLWSLLLIVPGIIAALKYSQAYYILADDPDKDIMQCIRESKEMMNGNKGKYFCLQLSFIGWYLLVYAAFMILAAIAFSVSFAFLSDAGFVISMVIIAVCVIAIIIICMFLTSDVMAASTIFYEMANGNLRPQSDELPPLSQQAPEDAGQTANDYPEINVDNNNNSVNEDKIEF